MLDNFKEIRLNDCITCVTCNSYGQAYATYLGSITYFNFSELKEQKITEKLEGVVTCMYLPESSYNKQLHEYLIDQQLLDNHSVGNFQDRYLLICLNDKYSIIYNLQLNKIVKLLDNNYNVGVLLNKYIYTNMYRDKFMMCIIYSDFKQKKTETTQKNKPFQLNDFISNSATQSNHAADLKEGTIPQDFDGERFLQGVQDEQENQSLWLYQVEEKDKHVKVYSHDILDGSESALYKWLVQTFHAMPVISNAWLVKGKNEIIVVKNEATVEKWELAESSYAKITHLGNTVTEVITSRLLLNKEFQASEFQQVPQQPKTNVKASLNQGVGGKELYSIQEESKLNKGVSDASQTLNFTQFDAHAGSHPEAAKEHSRQLTEDHGLGGKFRSAFAFQTLWTVETDHHVRCYNLESWKVEVDIDIRKLANVDDRIKSIDLFEMGQPYILQVYSNYVVISTDQGVQAVKI